MHFNNSILTLIILIFAIPNIIGAIVGLIASIFQTLIGLQEQSLAYVGKLIAIAIYLFFAIEKIVKLSVQLAFEIKFY